MMHRREKESTCTTEWSIICALGDGKALTSGPSPCKGPSRSLRRNGKNKTKVASTKQRLQGWLFLSSPLFKCYTSGLGVKQNTSLSYYQVFILGFDQCKWQEEAWKMESRRKGSGDVSASCIHILLAAVIGFSAAWSKMNWVSLCPGTQEVQPHHHRCDITSNNEVFRWCNGKKSEKVTREITWTKSVTPCGYPRMGNQAKAEMPRTGGRTLYLPEIQPS